MEVVRSRGDSPVPEHEPHEVQIMHPARQRLVSSSGSSNKLGPLACHSHTSPMLLLLSDSADTLRIITADFSAAALYATILLLSPLYMLLSPPFSQLLLLSLLHPLLLPLSQELLLPILATQELSLPLLSSPTRQPPRP